MVEISAAEAQTAIAAGTTKATEIGSPSSIAIVDLGRNLIAFQRMDGALLASIESRKARPIPCAPSARAHGERFLLI